MPRTVFHFIPRIAATDPGGPVIAAMFSTESNGSAVAVLRTEADTQPAEFARQPEFAPGVRAFPDASRRERHPLDLVAHRAPIRPGPHSNLVNRFVRRRAYTRTCLISL